MHSLDLVKPDGRHMTLYSREPLDPAIVAPSPFVLPLAAAAHLRWHPLRGEWVTYAAHRQERTFQPPPQYNPLAPMQDRAHPTEVPQGAWDMAVFENRFPSLGGPTAAPPELIVPTAPANGRCEVVVFTQNADKSLGLQSIDRIAMLFEVLADRTMRLGAEAKIQYVFPFENRGAECGVTLPHPHGQIYAYPIVPPVVARMQQLFGEHYAQHKTGLLGQHIKAERADAQRMLYEGEHAVAFVPACARYPYEVWVAPLRAVESFAALTHPERVDLARALKTVLRKYDKLWDRPFPYLMAWYQAPTDGAAHPESHLHAQLWPPYRTRDRLKFLAGTELGAGFFAMDVLPEDKARELQQIDAGVL